MAKNPVRLSGSADGCGAYSDAAFQRERGE